jgi:hypothetical protein
MINNPRTCPESLTHPLQGVRKISDQHDLGTGPLRAGVHAGETYDGVERGLLGYFVNASIENQFQFIMREWMNNYEFVGGTRLDPHAKGVITGTNNPGASVFEIRRPGRRAPAADHRFRELRDNASGGLLLSAQPHRAAVHRTTVVTSWPPDRCLDTGGWLAWSMRRGDGDATQQFARVRPAHLRRGTCDG